LTRRISSSSSIQFSAESLSRSGQRSIQRSAQTHTSIDRVGPILSNADSSSPVPFKTTSVRARRRHAFARSNESSKGWDVLAVIAIATLAVGIPLAVSWRTGSLSIPRNDDWAYRRAALYFYETGHVRLLGWSVLTLVGQIFWLWPFLKLLGAHPWVPALSVAVLAVFGIAAWYSLCRRVLSRGLAVLAVATCAAVPGFALNTSTFMTDIPAWALDGVCLAIGAIAIERAGWRRWSLLFLSLATGCYAFSIRDFSVAAPVAVIVVAWVSERRDHFAYALAAGLTIGACVLIFNWTNHLPGQVHGSPIALTETSIFNTVQLYFTLAFGLAPLVAWSAWRFRSSLAALVPLESVAVGIGVAIGVALATVPLFASRLAIIQGGSSPDWFIGNMLDEYGAIGLSASAGTRPVLFPAWVWGPMNFVAVITGVAILAITAVALVRLPAKLKSAIRTRVVPGQALLVGFTLLMGAIMLVYSLMATESVFDRYAWPLLCPVGTLLLVPVGSKALKDVKVPTSLRVYRLIGGALGCLLVGAALVTLLNSDTFDAALWRGGNYAVAAGYKATEVDAGFDWVAYHSRDGADLDSPSTPPPWGAWYDVVFPGFSDSDCSIASASPLAIPNLVLYKTVSYNEFWLAGPRGLYLYGAVSSRCPASPRP
jgi:4-amino-4-deoxy-L-arabinose transferase-like glycosyltransferase